MKHLAVATLAGLWLFAAALSVRAEMGPCQPDERDGLICGSGPGAARVIDKTISPNKRLALAWRTPAGDPTEEPGDEIQLLLVRLSDGAIMAKTATEYWNTGERHVNRYMEYAVWSRDSRMVVRAFHSRFETDNLDLYVLDAKDTLVGTIDLHKIVEPAVRAQIKQRRNADSYAFSVAADRKTSIGSDGAMRMRVTMWVPKEGPEANFDVALLVTSSKDGPSARVTSVRPVRARR